MFSSTAAFLGLARQTDYAAGNAYLDALALLRVGSGCARTHVAWGAVATLGLAALVSVSYCTTPPLEFGSCSLPRRDLDRAFHAEGCAPGRKPSYSRKAVLSTRAAVRRT